MSQPLTSMLVESQALYLDPAIRDWVLIPIMVVMVLVGIFRDQVTVLIGSTSGKKAGIKAIKETKALTRGVTLRNYGNNIPSSSFLIRKNYLCSSYKKGDFLKNPASANQVVNPMTDPAGMEMMMEGMKKNFAMIIPQTVIMGWINFFFSGFVLSVETPDMDVTWVSSLSWYFLNLFGLRSIFTLLLGEDNAADGMRDMAAMSQMGAASPGQPQDFNKLFLAESENLELTPHNWELDDIEVRLLVKYGKRELVDNKDIIEMEDISSNDLSDVKGKSKKKRT
ncbi:8336_t:CDS:2 [Funneliformis geosporum]|uniref:ER membrane protein complex subunit 3 n=1 Tax=Funneliformis geosporum TaxID=1117311 RepID=A0A9W4SSB4_9GLOM|nr:8336_t:CDS:2 [Funneliformis geosporum]